MNLAEFSLLTFAGSLAAGFLGALTGLGGGFIIVPFLTPFFGVDLRYNIGASLVSMIATSSGAAAAYLRDGFTNIRVAMFLEIATTVGAVCGSAVAHRNPASAIAVIFGVVPLHSAYLASRRRRPLSEEDHPDGFVSRLRLNPSYPKDGKQKSYSVRKVPLGFLLMWLAGILSGLQGIGSGALKVLAMDQVMRMPFKVSTTSTFTIGVTAAAGAGIYLNRGFIDPTLARPVMLGALLGTFAGSRTLTSAPPRLLRIVFAVVISIPAVEMILQGIQGKI